MSYIERCKLTKRGPCLKFFSLNPQTSNKVSDNPQTSDKAPIHSDTPIILKFQKIFLRNFLDFYIREFTKYFNMRFKMYYSPSKPGSSAEYNPVTANLINGYYRPVFDLTEHARHASNFDSIITYIKDLYDWKKVIEIKYISEDELYVVTLQDKRAFSIGMQRMIKNFELIVIPEQSKYFNFDLLNEDDNLFIIFRIWINDNTNS